MATLKKSVVKIKKAEDGYKHPEEAEPRKSEKIVPMKSVGKAVGPKAELQGSKETPKPQTFGEAFKAARAAGKGPFTWIDPKTGKKGSYSTETKEEAAKKSTPAVKPSTPAAKSTPATPAKKAEPAKVSPAPTKSTPAKSSGAGPMNPVKDQRGGYANSPERQKIVDAAQKNKQTLHKSGKVYPSHKSGGKTKKK